MSECIRLRKIDGIVIHGNHLGRTVGMPTANFEYSELNLQGVFVSEVILPNGDKKIGLTNIGTKPSVDSSGKKNIETHILDFDEDIYGQKLTLNILDKIRDIKKFNNLDEVKNQVDKDIKIAKDKFFKFFGADQPKRNKIHTHNI